MSDEVTLKPSKKQRGFRSSSPFPLGESPLPKGTPYREDITHSSHISTHSNSVSSSRSLRTISSPTVPYPSTPRGSLSRSSTPALNDTHRSASLVSTPVSTPSPDSRACSPYSLTPSTTYYSPPASPTTRSKESSPVRSSELYSGRWISPKAKKHCSEPPIPPSPLRAPPVLALMPSSSSSASSLSQASGVSSVSNASFSTAPTSLSNSQFMLDLGTSTPTEICFAPHGHQRHCSTSSGPISLNQYKSFSESISETCEKICEKLKRSLRVMWKQGKRCEIEQRDIVKSEETAETRPVAEPIPEPTVESTAVETPVKDGGAESMAKRWKRKSADGIRSLDKAYRQRKDSGGTKITDSPADSGPSPSSDNPAEKTLPPVPEVADFVDLRDPFACHTSGSPQVVKNTASALPPPSSFRYTAKIIEARRRMRRAAGLDRTGSGGKTGSAGRPVSSARPGSSGRPGSANSSSNRPKSKRFGASMCNVTTRRLRAATAKRSEEKPFPTLGPIVPPKDLPTSNLTSPFTYSLVQVRPLRVHKRSMPTRPSTPTPPQLVRSPSNPLESLMSNASTASFASQIPVASQKRASRVVVVKSSSPFSSPSSRPLTPPKRAGGSKQFAPFALTLPTGVMVDSCLPTPPLTPSSPVMPSFFSSPSASSSSLPQMPTSTRVHTPTGVQGISSAESRPDLRIVTPPLDGRLWI